MGIQLQPTLRQIGIQAEPTLRLASNQWARPATSRVANKLVAIALRRVQAGTGGYSDPRRDHACGASFEITTRVAATLAAALGAPPLSRGTAIP